MWALTCDGDTLYAVDGTRMYRSTDGGQTWDNGAAVPSVATYGGAAAIFKTAAGWALATRSTTENSEQGSLFFTDGFDTAWTHVLTTTRNGAYFDQLSCSAFSDGDVDIVLAGEYGRRGTEKKHLWLSTDGGQSYTSIRETVNDDTGVNSHWHCAVYDDGTIWACRGDGADNAGVERSDDLGQTWTTLGAVCQPTAVYPLPDRVLFGEDAQWCLAGIYRVERDRPDENQMRAYTVESGNPATWQYGKPGVVSGSTAWMPFNRQVGSDDHVVVKTSDGGLTFSVWYRDASVALSYLCGPDSGDNLYAIRSSDSTVVQLTA